MSTVQVALPAHLRTLARVDGDVQVDLPDSPTVDDLLEALDAKYPPLRGTIREHETGKRRAYMRFFACGRDISHEDQKAPLPDAIASGAEPFYILGAISGG